MHGDESILRLPLERKIFKNENKKESKGYISEDGKLKVYSLFSSKLRQGVAAWIQSKKKEFFS